MSAPTPVCNNETCVDATPPQTTDTEATDTEALLQYTIPTPGQSTRKLRAARYAILAQTEHCADKPLLCIDGRIRIDGTDHRINVMIDTGYSGHAIISKKKADKLKLTTEHCNHVIRLAEGSKVHTGGLTRNVDLALTQHHKEPIDMIVFPLSTYDVVLGMGWLTEHAGHILCDSRTLKFRSRGWSLTAQGTQGTNPELNLIDVHWDEHAKGEGPRINFISCNQLKKMAKDPDTEIAAAFLRESHNGQPEFLATMDLHEAKQMHGAGDFIEQLHAKMDHIPQDTRSKFITMLNEYKDTVFADQEYCSVEAALGREVQHEINEIPDQPHPCKNVYRLSPPMLEELRRQLQALLKGGLIRPSVSPYGAPVLFAKKPKEGTWRLCIDYRALNKITIKDRYPLPRADDLFDQLHGAKYFTKIDLRWGYHQVKIRPEDVKKTAFRTQLGSYEWLVMPFGLCNAPATFQRFVQNMLHDFLGHFAVVYIDDVLVYSKTADEHVRHVQQVLDKLKENKLLAKPSKCDFFTQKVEYLGHIITPDGIQVDPTKVDAIMQWETPATKTEVRSFLGLANYYRGFIKNFSEITAPLSALVHDDQPDPVVWTRVEQEAFDRTKRALTTAPVLRTYDPDLTTELVVDASSNHRSIGAALMQNDGNGLRPVAYFSRKMTPTEQRYCTREQELLAIRDALKHFRHYLTGIHFVLHTDHQSLRYLQTQPELSGKLLRWADFIAGFDMDVRYIKGAKNVVADALSRPPIRTAAKDSSEDHPLKHRTHITVTPGDILVMEHHTQDLRHQLLESQPVDPKFGPIISALKDPAFSSSTSEYRTRYTLREDVLFWHGGRKDKNPRVCVPASLRKDLLRDYHEARIAGHPGVHRTYQALSREYFWPRMFYDVKTFINSCTTCQTVKATNQAAAGLARPLPPPENIYDVWGLDFITKLPPTKDGENCLVVFSDHLSKKVHLVPTVSSTDPRDKDNPLSAEKTAQIYFDNIFRHYGLPRKIVSDRDGRFVSKFWQELHRLCGTRLLMSTAFHPQTDGATERTNRTAIDTITCLMQEHGDQWRDHVTAVEFAMNNAVQASTGMSPFFMTTGRHPRIPSTVDTEQSKVPAASKLVETLNTNISRATDAILQAQIAQVRAMDRHRRDSPFRVGDKVWLSTQNLRLETTSKHFVPKYIGPFSIVSLRSSGNAAELDFTPYPDFKKRGIHPVFNVSLLKPHTERPVDLGPVAQNRPPALAHDEGDDPFFEPDFIVKEATRGRGRRRKLHYLVRWLGYGPHEDTWEPADRLLLDCPQIVAEYQGKHRPAVTKSASKKADAPKVTIATRRSLRTRDK